MSKSTRHTSQDQSPKPMDWAAFQAVTWEQLPDLGLYMDQVITYVEQRCRPLYPQEKILTPAMVNNYVKSGLVIRPESKKYGRPQLAQLIMICTLKQALSQEEMKKLLVPAEDSASVASMAAKGASEVPADPSAEDPLEDPARPESANHSPAEALYRSFCATQTDVWAMVLARRDQESPLHFALEAAASKILCAEKIAAH